MAGGIDNIIRNALRTKWTLTDDFSFNIYNTKRPLNVSSDGIENQDVFDMAAISIDLPQLGSDVESVMQAGEWRIYNTKFQPFTFSVTFRDFGGLDLRNYFAAVWMDAQRGYFDDVKSRVIISVNGKIAFESKDCLITAVSQVQLDNSNSQIAEFSVEFSSPYFSNWQISKFGSDAYRNSEVGKITGAINSLSAGLNGVGIDVTGLGETANILDGLSNIASKLGNF